MYRVIVLLLLMCGLMYGMIFSSPRVIQDANNVNNPKSSAGEITIITPENKTYVGPDSGYYPATYGFENDKIGAYNENISLVDFKEGPAQSYVEGEIGNHKKVIAIEDHDGSVNAAVDNEVRTYGTVECWHRTTDVDKSGQLMLSSGGSPSTFVWIFYGIDNDKWEYLDSTSSYADIPNVPAPINNTWQHIRIDFRCDGESTAWQGLNENKWRVIIDGVSSGEMEARSVKSSISTIWYRTHSGDFDYTIYFDAIGYSWDPNYNIGDNLNEGLLLSYDNTTTLDWKGYSLDGMANKTILGNTTIPMPSEGTHNIQVFGNDTMGTMYQSDLRYFTVNTAPPDITINSPTDSQIISSTAPSYDISIAGPYDSIWYALECGTNNTATGLTGIIDQSVWSALSDGIITVDFYANNSAGMEGSAQVQVIKDSSEEPPPGIPGYDLYILIGALSIISALIIRKRLKS